MCTRRVMALALPKPCKKGKTSPTRLKSLPQEAMMTRRAVAMPLRPLIPMKNILADEADVVAAMLMVVVVPDMDMVEAVVEAVAADGAEAEATSELAPELAPAVLRLTSRA
jgi:hypothetical protein